MNKKPRILSNDYLGNVPNHTGVVQGGTAVFARSMRDWVRKDGGQWIGVFHDGAGDTLDHAIVSDKQSARYISFTVPQSSMKKISNLSRAIRPDRLMNAEISYAMIILTEQKPDIVFLNGFYTFPWILFEAARRLNIPTVVQHAGVWAKEIRQYSDKFTPHARRASYWIERQSAHYADANIFLNETSRDAFAAIHRLTKISNECIIPLPHPGWKFCVGDRRVREQKILGCVARWDRIKNHAGLLAFAQACVKQRLSWKIRCVTSIPNTVVMKDFKKKYRKHIEVVAPMTREELGSFYKELDVLLVPSHFDVSPTVVMESMSHGVPALISPGVGWASEYRASGMSSWITRFDRPASAVRVLAKHFRRTSWNEVKKLANNIETWHSPATVYQSYLRLFRRCSSNRR